ncbi:helix-turn-helix domain-containing protein [Halopiger xanaduensis]|uniref:Bacterio-opsin activator HTH domain protein n=1 Tax=Halopiger xanaduensis (strain DSM 18323 / JCM 14033 / SH-6) TaxID=797210 RepID=F8D6Z1_HALXS|nr:helix-turn-helix domain-containing protein [Halopiger xanaduensis]AEH35420.1 Bacterio-opsin activator HTH domain protein [Halopiger xanaduensis SH-6]
MLVAEFVVEAAVLQRTLSAFPDIRLTHEAQYLTADGTVRLFFRMAGVDPATFESTLESDPTVTNARRIDRTDSTALYRVDFTVEGRAKSTFPRWAIDDVVLLEATGTPDGWRIRMRVPDRETLLEYREAYSTRGCSFALQSLSLDQSGGDGLELYLSPSQRDALVSAYELGYFEIPRRISQEELGVELGISAQSVSERLRRAVSSLVESLLGR